MEGPAGCITSSPMPKQGRNKIIAKWMVTCFKKALDQGFARLGREGHAGGIERQRRMRSRVRTKKATPAKALSPD